MPRNYQRGGNVPTRTLRGDNKPKLRAASHHFRTVLGAAISVLCTDGVAVYCGGLTSAGSIRLRAYAGDENVETVIQMTTDYEDALTELVQEVATEAAIEIWHKALDAMRRTTRAAETAKPAEPASD